MQASNLVKHRFAKLLLAALLVQTVTCAETAKQASRETVSPHVDSNLTPDMIPSSTNSDQTSATDQTKDSSHDVNIPSVAASSQTTGTQIVNIPITSSETTDLEEVSNNRGDSPFLESYTSDTENGLNLAEGDLYPTEFLYQNQAIDELKNIPGTEANEYMLLHLPSNEKRFMRGLKRDFDIMDSTEGEFPNQEFNEKRFMRGFNKYAKKDDKRFMRGLREDNSFLIDGDKRFMRGLRSLDYENMDDKRFIIGLNRFARIADKRFMRGFTNYNKRFIHGLQNYGKRFMRGLVKRDESGAMSNEKRFIVGLNGYGRRANDLHINGAPGADLDSDNIGKRFMKGFHAYVNNKPGKRFMKGFGLYSKKYSPVSDEVTDDSNISSDKRFMRGLTKKERGSEAGINGVDNGLMHLSEIQSDDTNNGNDKRFIKGLTRKSDDINNINDKRFMRGLVKKSNDINEYVDKRFIKGLSRKFEDDKRFMRGLNKKFDESEDKRFIKGLGKKDTSFDDSLDNDLKNEEDGRDKKFMRGFGKKNLDEEELQSISDKRFMRGLYAKKDNNKQGDKTKKFMRGFKNFAKKDHEFTDDEMNSADKRFIKGLQKNKVGVQGKRFMKGLQKYVKKEEAVKNMEGSELAEDKRFMRGLVKKADVADDINDEKRFMRGLVKKEDSDSNPDGDGSKTDSEKDKKFMRGLVKHASGQSREKRDTRFRDDNDADLLRKLEDSDYHNGDVLLESDASGTWHDLPAYPTGFSIDKRFMRGLGRNVKRYYAFNDNNSEFDDIDEESNNGLDISKRFIRGFLDYYNSGKEFLPKRFHYALTNSDDFNSTPGTGKRFIKGLDMYTRPANGKRFMRGIQQYGKRDADDSYYTDKRFMRGLNPYTGSVGKRFIRGFGKYVKRPIMQAERENTYSSTRFSKRSVTGHNYLVSDNQQQSMSPAFRHSQLMSSYYNDQHSLFQPNRDHSRIH